MTTLTKSKAQKFRHCIIIYTDSSEINMFKWTLKRFDEKISFQIHNSHKSSSKVWKSKDNSYVSDLKSGNICYRLINAHTVNVESFDPNNPNPKRTSTHEWVSMIEEGIIA